MEAALSELMTRLAELDSESRILKAAQGFQSLCNKELIQARDSFLKGITSVFIDIFFFYKSMYTHCDSQQEILLWWPFLKKFICTMVKWAVG